MVRLRISRPEVHPEGDWLCRVQAEGLRGGDRSLDVAGVSSFQALALGIRCLRSIVVEALKAGVRLRFADGNVSGVESSSARDYEEQTVGMELFGDDCSVDGAKSRP
jgi:hypothetical protein